MTAILRPGSGFVYMKVGTHAQEPLVEILRRKQKEITDAGFALWGYGGPTCHPINAVQPFARNFERRGQSIYLCMQEMTSKHFADPIRAVEMSVDGSNWSPIPPAISVKGSRYALVLKDLREETFELALSSTRVAVGNYKGKPGSSYISGRVDKACLELPEVGETTSEPGPVVRISLVAEVAPPYALFVRN